MTTVAEDIMDRTAPAEPQGLRATLVAPRHRDDPEWPWLTRVEPMSRFAFRRLYIDNVHPRLPKLSGPSRVWQLVRAARLTADADVTFTFSTDIAIGLSSPPAGLVPRSRRIYVGFTQDGPWPDSRVARVGRAMRAYDAVSVFTDAERDIYLDRYGVAPDRMRVIPIHTDESDGYRKYPDAPPRAEPYALALGSPNRRFRPIAAACRDLGIPLIIMTRPTHRNDDLQELADLGAEVITDADRPRALTHLKHARLATMVFDDPGLPGGYTTLVHAMFMQTPFVVTDCLGMREHVVDGETGFVVPHGDDAMLADAIERLWTDADEARRFGAAALTRARARHSLEAAAASFHALAQDVVAR